MSLYKAYLTEKTDKFVIETDKGFIVFNFPDDKTCYIEDVFVLKEHRNSYAGSDLVDQVYSIAKSKNCSKILGSIVPTSKNSTASLKAIMAYGMQLDSATTNFILFSKEIK